MKIICKDNFDRETTSEWLIASNIESEDFAKTMAKALNDKYGSEYSSFYAAVVPDDYALYRFEP